jgi:hypothetical protein
MKADLGHPMFAQDYTRQKLVFDLNAIAFAGVSFVVTLWIAT